MNWIKLGGYVLIIIPTLFVGVVLGFYLIQDYMIFLGERLPKNHKYNFKAQFEEINFVLPDSHVVNALLFKTENPKGLIYYHHGNAGNLQGWGNFAPNFLRNDYDVLFYDFRGYGKSSGRIKQQHQLHDDAEFILQKMRDKYDKIVYYGISLGSGIASKLAMDFPADALILETPYYNFLDLIHYHYPYLPANLMSKYKLRTDKYISHIDCPIMLVHGTDDEIITFDSSVRLAALNDKVQMVTIKNGVHNNLTDFEKYHLELKKFLSDL